MRDVRVLWLLRGCLLATVLALMVPLLDLLGPDLTGLFVFGVVLPLPCYLALGLLWRAESAERVHAGLFLARSIGLLHLPPLFLLVHYQLRLAWPPSQEAIAVLASLALLSALLAGAAWWLLRSTPADPDTGWTRERALSGVGHLVVFAYVLVFVMVPRNGHELPRRESAAIGDLRALSWAEATYSAQNGDHFGPPGCLVDPASCLPDYPASSPRLLDPGFARATRRGYVFTFHGMPATPEETRRAHAAPGSLKGYAYVAVPEAPGRSGVRAFCIEASGVLRQSLDGSMPAIADGRCPETLKPWN
jgi:hypothetical protein